MAAFSSTTTRVLALAALVLAAGLFSVRALSVFTAAAPAPGVQTDGRSLNGLLRTLHGPNTLQLTERIEADGSARFLVLLNADLVSVEDRPAIQADIQAVLSAAADFSADQDQISFIYAPFAIDAAVPTALEIAELTGLGALFVLALIGALAPTFRRTEVLAAPQPRKAAMPTDKPPAELAEDPMLAQATGLASQSPEQAVKVIRKWMRQSPGGNA